MKGCPDFTNFLVFAILFCFFECFKTHDYSAEICNVFALRRIAIYEFFRQCFKFLKL